MSLLARPTNWLLAAVLNALVCATMVHAAPVTLVYDPFTDGAVTNGGDPQDVAWYANTGAFYVGPETPAPGSGNYVSWNPGTDSPGSTNFTYSAMHSESLPTWTLANPGDRMTLDFDFLFYRNPGNQASALRFGLYNDAGTSDASATNDDFGYYANISSGTTKNHQLYRENGGESGPLGGTDRTQLGATETTLAALDSQNPHNLLMELTRTLDGLRVRVEMDGVTYLDELDALANNPFFSFNKIMLGNAAVFDTGNTQRFRFDNITLTATVPEPSTWALALLGLLGFGWVGWRKRRAA